jgi:hypothetical protein
MAVAMNVIDWCIRGILGVRDRDSGFCGDLVYQRYEVCELFHHFHHVLHVGMAFGDFVDLGMDRFLGCVDLLYLLVYLESGFFRVG